MRKSNYILMTILALNFLGCAESSSLLPGDPTDNKHEGEKGYVFDSNDVFIGYFNRYLDNQIIYIDSPNGYTYGIELGTNLFIPMNSTSGSSDDFANNYFYKGIEGKDFWNEHTELNAPEQYFFVMSYEATYYDHIDDEVFCKKKDSRLLKIVFVHNLYVFADNVEHENTGKSYYFTNLLRKHDDTFFNQYRLEPCTFSEVGLPDNIQFPLFLIVDDEGTAEEISETNRPTI